MFWQIVILIAVQITHVICYCDSKSSSSCAVVYSQLENLCYDFTGKAGDYFSVQDIHQRDGFFAIREAALYVAYNACGKITRSIDNYRTGQDLEKNKITPGGSNPSPGGGSTPTPGSSPDPNSSSPASTPPTSNNGPASPTPSSSSPSTTTPPSSTTPSPSTSPSPQTPPSGSPPP